MKGLVLALVLFLAGCSVSFKEKFDPYSQRSNLKSSWFYCQDTFLIQPSRLTCELLWTEKKGEAPIGALAVTYTNQFWVFFRSIKDIEGNDLGAGKLDSGLNWNSQIYEKLAVPLTLKQIDHYIEKGGLKFKMFGDRDSYQGTVPKEVLEGFKNEIANKQKR